MHTHNVFSRACLKLIKCPKWTKAQSWLNLGPICETRPCCFLNSDLFLPAFLSKKSVSHFRFNETSVKAYLSGWSFYPTPSHKYTRTTTTIWKLFEHVVVLFFHSRGHNDSKYYTVVTFSYFETQVLNYDLLRGLCIFAAQQRAGSLKDAYFCCVFLKITTGGMQII